MLDYKFSKGKNTDSYIYQTDKMVLEKLCCLLASGAKRGKVLVMSKNTSGYVTCSLMSCSSHV